MELGFNVHQSKDIGVNVTAASGTKWVRIDLNWLNVEPNEQGVFDFGVIDPLVDAANAKGLKVLAVVGYTPGWASQGDLKGGGSTNDVPKAGTFAPFVTAVVNRYKAKGVTHYEIWNEPNLEQFFEGDVNAYLERVLLPGADAVHAACSSCLVVGPGLATVGDQYGKWMDAIFPVAKSKIDIVSGHIYHDFPVAGGGAGVTSDSFFNKLESHRIVKLGSATVYEGPQSFKEAIDKHGMSAKPFWLTETGREANAGNANEETAQTTYYQRVLEEMGKRPWWTGTIFYEAFDEPPAPYRWGVVVHDDNAMPNKWVAKPALAYLQKFTSSQPTTPGGPNSSSSSSSASSSSSSTAGGPTTSPSPGRDNEGSVANDGTSVTGNDGGGGGGCASAGSETTINAVLAMLLALVTFAALRRRAS
jgi:hypothetical protein